MDSLEYRLYDTVEDKWLPGTYTVHDIRKSICPTVGKVHESSREGFLIGKRYKPWPIDDELDFRWNVARLLVLGDKSKEVLERNSSAALAKSKSAYVKPNDTRINMSMSDYADFSTAWDKYRFMLLGKRVKTG